MQGTVEKQANRYTQGTRTVYNFTMTFQEVEENLRRRLPEDFAQMLETNRAMDPKRVNALEKYLTDTPDWVLQPLTLAANAGSTEFNVNGEDSAYGHLTLNHDDDTPVRIIDGQHRRQAIHQLIDKEQAAGTAPQAQNWHGQEIGVTLFIEDASKSCVRCSPTSPRQSPSTGPPKPGSTPPTRSTTSPNRSRPTPNSSRPA